MPRTVPLQVLSLGMSRTGTTSMQSALLTLGFIDTHHGFHILEQPWRAEGWERAADAKFSGVGTACDREVFDELLGDCAAVTDSPPIMFAEELINCYPDAKVVLVERDISAWKRSFGPLIEVSFGWRSDIWYYITEPIIGTRVFAMQRKLFRGYFRGTSGAEILENAEGVYLEHYRMVRALTPKDRLLEYKLGDGWEPLCRFLEKEVPEVDFPWVNEAKELEQRVGKATLKSLGIALKRLKCPGIIVGLVFASWFALNKWTSLLSVVD